jgi:hypothetical protein
LERGDSSVVGHGRSGRTWYAPDNGHEDVRNMLSCI